MENISSYTHIPLLTSNTTLPVPTSNDSITSLANSTTKPALPGTTLWQEGQIRIPLYSIILVLAVVGNFLVIITLVQNARMRTITNLFLLNLAVSDLLLGVFCMPFTLVGTLMRDFVFGEFMCKFIPFLQGKLVHSVKVRLGVYF